MNYGLTKEVNISYEQAIKKVTEELKKEGFGILTTIDVKDTLKKKIDVDFNKYIILGACNPDFAYQALQADKSIGLLLPCNAIVFEDRGKVTVSIMNPEIMSSFSKDKNLIDLSKEVKKVLQKVINNI